MIHLRKYYYSIQTHRRNSSLSCVVACYVQACKTPEQKNEWNVKLRNLVGTKLLFEFQQQANLVRNSSQLCFSLRFYSFLLCGSHLPCLDVLN